MHNTVWSWWLIKVRLLHLLSRLGTTWLYIFRTKDPAINTPLNILVLFVIYIRHIEKYHFLFFYYFFLCCFVYFFFYKFSRFTELLLCILFNCRLPHSLTQVNGVMMQCNLIFFILFCFFFYYFFVFNLDFIKLP